MAPIFNGCIWRQFDAYLRTRSRQLPSEKTVKHVIARLLLKYFLSSAPSAIMREIKKRYFTQKYNLQIESAGIES